MDDIFSGTRGLHNAKIMIVGESYGKIEAERGMPFVGSSGTLLEDLLFDAALPYVERHPHTDLLRDSVFITNVVNEQPKANDMWHFFHPTTKAKKEGMLSLRGLYPMNNVLRGLDKLYKQIDIVDPDLIIGFGNYTLWALTEDFFNTADSSRPRYWPKHLPYPTRKAPTGIVSRRGSQLYTETTSRRIPFMPTIHPAAFSRAWHMRHWVMHDMASRAPLAFKPGRWDPPAWNFITRPDFETAMSTLSALLERAEHTPALRLASDIETKPGKVMTCVGLAWSKVDAICIPFLQDTNKNYWTPEQEHAIVQKLIDIHTHRNIQIIGQNFTYDQQYIWHEWGVEVTPHMDTMLAQHVIWPGDQKGLHFLASMYADYYVYWKDEGKSLKTKDDNEGWVYNCKDCVYTLEVSHVLDKLLNACNLREQYNERMAQYPMAFDMTAYGVPIDHAVRNELRTELMRHVEEHEHLLYDMVPEDVPPPAGKNAAPWYRSDDQLRAITYKVLGVKPVIKPDTGQPTLDKNALPILREQYPELSLYFNTIEELRSLNNSYGAASAKLDPDGKLRCSIKLSGPETMRWATAKNPYDRGQNMQNISTGNEVDE